MHRYLVLAAVAAALAAVPNASAKGPFAVCGSSGCAQLALETEPLHLFDAPAVAVGPVAAPAPAPYYTVRFSDDVGGALAYWIPSAKMLRLHTGGWVATTPDDEALLLDKTAGLTPYAAPTTLIAYVDYQRVKRPTGWLKLFTIGTPVSVTTSHRSWYEVWLRGGHSPWNDGASQLWISQSGNLLMRDGVTVAIPKATANAIRKRLPLG